MDFERFVDCVFEVFLNPTSWSALGPGALHCTGVKVCLALHVLQTSSAGACTATRTGSYIMIPMNPRQVHGDKLLRQTVNYSTFKYILFKFSVIHENCKNL